VHIHEGILPPHLSLGGYLAAGAAAGLALRGFDERRIPQVAVMASLFFVVSSIPLPLPGATSLHLLLNGLLGVVLGWPAVPAVLLSLVLQALLLGHGGITAAGVNTVTIGGGAIAAHLLFRLRLLAQKARPPALEGALGALAAAAALVVSGALHYAALYYAYRADPRFRSIAGFNLAAHLPLLVIEPLVTAFAVAFLARVKPELLGPGEGRR
jgi:cobalt/nickel transport system permease protein